MLRPCAMSFFQKPCPAAFPPASCSFSESHLGPQCCLYNLLEGQPGNSWPMGGECPLGMISNPSRYSGLHLPCFLQHVQQQHLLSGPARVGDRHTMSVRSPSFGGIPSRAVGLPGIMFATLGVSLAGHLGPNPYHPSPGSNVHSIFWGTSGLLPLINLFLSHLLTPTTRTLPPCRQHCSTLIVIKIL